MCIARLIVYKKRERQEQVEIEGGKERKKEIWEAVALFLGNRETIHLPADHHQHPHQVQQQTPAYGG